jgi:hypothetical protein
LRRDDFRRNDDLLRRVDSRRQRAEEHQRRTRERGLYGNPFVPLRQRHTPSTSDGL